MFYLVNKRTELQVLLKMYFIFFKDKHGGDAPQCKVYSVAKKTYENPFFSYITFRVN